MTLEETYREGRRRLAAAGVDSPAFDAISLFQKYFGLDRQALILRGAEPAGEEPSRAFLAAADERAAGRPLQYLLGVWPFLDMELAVGEGVLVPREETELLVREGAARLRRERPAAGDGAGLAIADLCSGSGCIGCAVARSLPRASVVLADISSGAMEVARRNVARNGLAGRVSYMLCDATAPPPVMTGQFDLIVSNPPYISAIDLLTLDPSVRDYEPIWALDGGEDGLDFYRAIVENWTGTLRGGGAMMFEVGEDQAAEVKALMRSAGLRGEASVKDTRGVERVVKATL